jgi:threonine synthase
VGVIERYREYLPVTDATPALSLCEGSTPLIRAERIERELNVGRLYFKFEGLNPTGSFKDRGMVMAVAKALEEGAQAILCASTGNTSASAAAYAARSGISAIVLVPAGNIALGKFAQSLMYQAKALEIEGNFDDALRLARQLTEKHPITLVNSVNPFRIEGQKTAAFEIIEALGDAPDHLFIPVGNAGNITAYWKGFKEFGHLGKATRLPRMMGFQAEGAAPIVRNEVVLEPQTIATAIRIGNPASWQGAVAARQESEGVIEAVWDGGILKAYGMLAGREGIFCEPASAISLAGLMQRIKAGDDYSESTVVCVLTGNGLKDPDVAVKQSNRTRLVPADLAAVEQVLGL